MKTGMSTACFFPSVYTEQAVDMIAKRGINTIEIFFSCMAEYDAGFIFDLKKRVEDNGISVYSVHALSTQFEPQLFSMQKRARQEARGIFMRVLEAAAALGAGAYVFHGPTNVKRNKISGLNYRYIAETAGELADLARGYGVRLAWENVHWCWYAEPAFAERLLAQPGTGNIYFTLDLKQAAQSGYSPSEYLKPIRSRLADVHVCDWVNGAERGVMPVLPFRGEADLGALKSDLKTCGYDGALIYEVYRDGYGGSEELFGNYRMFETFFSD